MRKKITGKILSLLIIVFLLAGCGSDGAGGLASALGKNDGEEKYPEFITVDVFDAQSNYQGIQSGWFAQIVKDKFNMELNIIAPNVAGGGETLYQTRSAAGNLGDLIIAEMQGGQLQELVTSGLVMDMSSYMNGQDNLKVYEDAIFTTNRNLVEEEGIWGIPSEVTTQSPTDMINTTTLNSGIYIRWDLYKELGYPEMETYEDLLYVMQDMQAIAGNSDSGKPVYAFSLFKDWDGAMIKAGQDIPSNYGWSTESFVLQKADDSEEPVDFLAENSPYIRNLKFYFCANQMGLLDPESTTQNYDTLYSKYEDGAVLYSPWPWQGAAAYNTIEHTEAGKGFQTASINDLLIREWGCYSAGNAATGIMVGSQAQDAQRMVDFIDWLYSPEGIQLQWFMMTDEMYEVGEEGPVLTELGRAALIEGDAVMPENYGGGSYKDGRPMLNLKVVSLSETNPETGYPYAYQTWESYIDTVSGRMDKDWQEYMGALNAAEFWKSTGRICISPGTAYVTPADSHDIATMRLQIEKITKEYSWQAIYAADEEEFWSIIAEMRETAIGLGYSEVVAVDRQNATDLKAAREEVLKSE
ncbi:MAG: ABC transporter substrate-binding protein [Lachnospiraceae bacterium]